MQFRIYTSFFTCERVLGSGQTPTTANIDMCLSQTFYAQNHFTAAGVIRQKAKNGASNFKLGIRTNSPSATVANKG